MLWYLNSINRITNEQGWITQAAICQGCRCNGQQVTLRLLHPPSITHRRTRIDQQYSTYIFIHSAKKGDDGRVVTSPRNIFSGTTSNPQLQKNFFSYTPSAFSGSEHQDPGKHELQQNLAQSKMQEGKDVYKPVKINKTLYLIAYSACLQLTHTWAQAIRNS